MQYADLPGIVKAIQPYRGETDLGETLSACDLVICTIFTSVELVRRALDTLDGRGPRVAYYIQDYEPLFCALEDPLHEVAMRSYTALPDALCFAKTDWIRRMVTLNHGVEVHKVQPSLDGDLYHPSATRTSSVVRVACMVRTATPRRAPHRTMAVLKELRLRHGQDIEIDVFGSDDAELMTSGVTTDFEFVNHGRLRRHEVATLLRSSDVFMDLSDYQAFGRTGLEAMACGCTCAVPSLGGTDEYAVHGINALRVDTRDREAALEAASRLVSMPSAERARMRRAAIETASAYSVRSAALSELRLFEEYLKAA